ncbi:MAG: phenylalanine--tRNA ligase subunit beta [Bacteroidales bacterium]|nr:phenylalanine--tRNA ligase subunit beta [Bacteroidales bacterium]
MNISYKWLKDYLKVDLSVEEISKILTSIGLEVGSTEEFESIKGGLKGLIVGEVLTCEKHSNADSLSVTTVNVGDRILPIVCGAPNVAAGQKVVVATPCTVLYSGDESFEIKKSKIRGEVSEGMICAEDEIGIGTSHAGIIELPLDTKIGIPAAQYFKMESDTILEVDLTPNRIDAASHLGVARDIAAYLRSQNEPVDLQWPSVDHFKIDRNNENISVELKNTEACHRYSGLTIRGLKVGSSPEWLQTKLKAIGQTPINNVVDVTNFILHEMGQPLHAFDLDIVGQKVIVDSVAEGTTFKTLDGQDRQLSDKDLMICNAEKPMCIAGVFGGHDSGVKNETTAIFLESAYFDSVWVRKTAKRHTLSTDASFRFERGTDPNLTIYALKRAAMLIKEVAGGEITSDIIDIYPEPIKDFEVQISIDKVHQLIGTYIGEEKIINILKGLDIKVEQAGDLLNLKVPPYRVDVQREADVIEEILRIFGYNNVPVSSTIHSAITYAPKPDKAAIVYQVSEWFSANGFSEMMANSLTKADYYQDLNSFPSKETVVISNPLSTDLNAMRQTLLFGALESVVYNQNRKMPNLHLYEFGNCSSYLPKEGQENPQKNYKERFLLALTITGESSKESWHGKPQAASFYTLKKYIDWLFQKLRIDNIKSNTISNDIWAEGMEYEARGQRLVRFGIIEGSLLSKMDIDNDVYYAEFDFDAVLKLIPKQPVQYQAVPKFPEVRRDLALLVDNTVAFADLKQLAEKVEKKLLKKVDIFDVYKGNKLESGKKSYALSFIFQDDKTMSDQQVDKIMGKMIFLFEKEFGAKVR